MEGVSSIHPFTKQFYVSTSAVFREAVNHTIKINSSAQTTLVPDHKAMLGASGGSSVPGESSRCPSLHTWLALATGGDPSTDDDASVGADSPTCHVFSSEKIRFAEDSADKMKNDTERLCVRGEVMKCTNEREKPMHAAKILRTPHEFQYCFTAIVFPRNYALFYAALVIEKLLGNLALIECLFVKII